MSTNTNTPTRQTIPASKLQFGEHFSYENHRCVTERVYKGTVAYHYEGSLVSRQLHEDEQVLPWRNEIASLATDAILKAAAPELKAACDKLIESDDYQAEHGFGEDEIHPEAFKLLLRAVELARVAVAKANGEPAEATYGGGIVVDDVEEAK